MSEQKARMNSQPSVLVLNGPNLNMLGKREPEHYGHLTLEEIEQQCVEKGKALGLAVRCEQNNGEGAMVDAIQSCLGRADAIIINAGAYTHSSIAIHDALRATGIPFVEVHLSNIYAREDFRHHSYLSSLALGVICGFGAQGYDFALQALAQKLRPKA